VNKDKEALYVTVEMRLDGPWGTPESVAAAVRFDMEENYQTDLQLSQPRVIGVSTQRAC